MTSMIQPNVHEEAFRYAERRLEDVLRPVDERLYEWGKWTRNCGINVGFPYRTALGRVIEEGPSGASQAPPPTVLPTPVLDVDQAVARLRGIRQRVLVVAYARLPNASTDTKRRKLNMSKHAWKRHLRESRIIVATILGYEV